MMRVVVLAATIVAGSWAGTTAFADGEVGLVIQYAEGQTDTHCVAFQGDAVSGDRVLALAGLPVNQFSGVVCAIGGTGCTHSGSFDSCTCECKAGSGDCTYWSYFTQPYGETWRYSVLGFQSAKARDGDLQAWRWGEGSAASAPPPAATTFETVCGHAPGDVASTVAPVSTVPSGTAVANPTAMLTVTPGAATAAPPATIGGSTASANRVVTPPAPTVTEEPATSTPEPPATGAPADEGTGSSGERGGLTAFAVAAGTLVVAIAAGTMWRRRRGD